jgi:hypothetical protein
VSRFARNLKEISHGQRQTEELLIRCGHLRLGIELQGPGPDFLWPAISGARILRAPVTARAAISSVTIAYSNLWGCHTDRLTHGKQNGLHAHLQHQAGLESGMRALPLRAQRPRFSARQVEHPSIRTPPNRLPARGGKHAGLVCKHAMLGATASTPLRRNVRTAEHALGMR